jgi:hypothetical protein
MRQHSTRPPFFIEAVEHDGKIQTDTRLALMPK